MKKMLPVLLCLLLLAGCGAGGLSLGESAAEQALLDTLLPHYETDIHMQLGEDTLTAHIAHPTPEQCEVTLTGPDSVAGLGFRFRQDSVDMSYKELNFSLDPDGMPPGAPAKLLVDALALLLRADDPAQLSRDGENNWELRAQLIGTGECVLVLDGTSGIPRKLFLTDLEWEIQLENFIFFS